MKYILALLVLLLSCTPNKKQTNLHLKIKLEQAVLDAIVIKKDDTYFLKNSDEIIHLNAKEKGYKIGSHYSRLIFDFNKQKGTWIRDNKENYQVPFTIEKTDKTDLYKSYEKENCAQNFSGKWKIQLSSTKIGLGNFKQIGCRVKGSILTTTGDYRYLDGYLNKGKIKLTGFDGVFAFVFNLNLKKDTFEGTMYAGNSYNTKIKAFRDDSFKLADADEMTKIEAHEKVTIKLKDLNDKLIDISSDEYQDKPKIIQLFGSWCPNCIDETKFFNRWRQENKELNNKVKFIALGFENFEDKNDAIKALKKVKTKLAMDYPIILVDYNKSVSANEILPIDKVRAYPTTLLL